MKDLLSLYVERLQDVLPENLTVSRMYLGCSWVGIELSDGSYGIAAKQEGDYSTLCISKMPLRDIPPLLRAANPAASAAACAAINACCNTPARTAPYAVSSEVRCVSPEEVKDREVAVIGYMKGIISYVEQAGAFRVYPFDLRPLTNVLPPEKESEILPHCDVIIMTGMVLMNHTYNDVASWSGKALKILLGPSVPFFPQLPGIHRLCGFSVLHPADFERENLDHPGFPIQHCRAFLAAAQASTP
jgi:uncharacterized protein (DUF4213/DUF364 family)